MTAPPKKRLYSSPSNQKAFKDPQLSITQRDIAKGLGRMAKAYEKASDPNDIAFLDGVLLECVPVIQKSRRNNGGPDVALKVLTNIGNKEAWPQRKNVPVDPLLQMKINSACISVISRSPEDNIFPKGLESYAKQLDTATSNLPEDEINERKNGSAAYLTIAKGWVGIPFAKRKDFAARAGKNPIPATYYIEQAAACMKKAMALSNSEDICLQAVSCCAAIVDAALNLPEDREAGQAFAKQLAQELGTDSRIGQTAHEMVNKSRKERGLRPLQPSKAPTLIETDLRAVPA